MTSPPSEEVRTELAGALEVLPTRLGDVYRLTTAGLEAEQIAAKLGVSTSNFVWNSRAFLRTILEGVPPRGRTMVPQAAGQVRRLLRTASLSSEAQDYLTHLLRQLEDRSEAATPAPPPSRTSQHLPPRPQRSPRAGTGDVDPSPSQTEVSARLQAPSKESREAVQDFLREDQTRLGQVFRLTELGLNPEAIAQELGVRTSGFVSNNRIIARALIDGVPPRSDSLKRQAAARARSLQSASGLSADVRTYFHQLEAALIGATATTGEGQSWNEDPPLSREAGDDVSPDRLRGMLESLIQRIEAETDVRPGDYEVLADDPDIVIAIGKHVGAHKAGETFIALFQRHRLDLTLESFMVRFGRRLGVSDQDRQMAEDRLMYFTEQD